VINEKKRGFVGDVSTVAYRALLKLDSSSRIFKKGPGFQESFSTSMED